MKKIYINNLDTEKRNYLIKLNSKLMNQLLEDLYEVQMYQMDEEARCIMNDDALRSIEYHDHYSSFFYTLLDWRRFVENIDADYLSEKARETFNDVMNNIKTLDEMDQFDDAYYNLEAELEEKTSIILKDIEELLHSYEDYPSEDDAIQYADEMERLDDYYIEEREDGTSDNVIRLDVSYTECFI